MNITPVNNTMQDLSVRQPDTSSISKTEKSFSEFIKNSVEQVNNSQVDGDKAITSIHNGEAQNLHDVMIAVEQADISLRMLVQVRNKALQAYEEIMRIQV